MVLGSPSPNQLKKNKKKTLSKLDPLWQNFLDPRMKSLGTVHESVVQVTYASSEGPSEHAHSCIIGYQKHQGAATSWLVGKGLYSVHAE